MSRPSQCPLCGCFEMCLYAGAVGCAASFPETPIGGSGDADAVPPTVVQRVAQSLSGLGQVVDAYLGARRPDGRPL